MYQEFFGLCKIPFSLTPDPSFLFSTVGHREALAGLLFAIHYRKGFVVLIGDAGTGKTTLLRTMLKRVSAANTIFSFLVHPTLTPDEFLEYTLLDFGLSAIPASKAQRLTLFHQFLQRSYEEGKTPVLVVDEAQKLSPELLEEIRLLTNSETAEQKLLQIVLAGQNELGTVLDRTDMRQLRQRIAVRLNVRALNSQEVLQYMQTRWLRAGASQPLPFSSEAVDAVAEYSQGIPRVINGIADAALQNAFATESRKIDADQVRTAVKDLQLAPFSPGTQHGAHPLAVKVPASAELPVRKHITANGQSFRTLERYMPAEDKKPGLMRWAARFGLRGA